MGNEIVCVYQDCILCGDRGKKYKKLIFDNKLSVRKVSFASEEGKNLIHEAVFKHGIGSMPFFTDGIRYSYRLEDFIGNEVDIVEKSEEIAEKPQKKAKKTKKGGKK